nr:hypothetical protein [Candidatus Neomarinimicrobiota bacterium]
MTDDLSPDQIQNPDVSSAELDDVIHANKNLYDKLNQLPEIEALDEFLIEDDDYDDVKH